MTSSLPMVRLMHQLDGTSWYPVGTIFSVDGTLYPGAPGPPWPYAGFASDIAWGLMTVADGMWLSDFIAYPATVGSMQSSANIGRGNLTTAIMNTPLGWPIVLAGYSQGAIVTDQCWLDDFVNPKGVLHDRYLNGDLKAIFNYGDPLRAPGVANGNLLAGIPLPKHLDGVVTGGIGGPMDLTPAQTPPHLFSCALDGDLYACCPVGSNPWGHNWLGSSKEAAPGKVGTGIFNVIMHANFWNVIGVAKDLGHPIAMVEEIVNGLTFAAAGPRAPHWAYGPYIGAAVGWMVELGLSLAG